MKATDEQHAQAAIKLAKMSAFPSLAGDPGLNMLEYFAARAPEAPNWFNPEMPPKPQMPDWEKITDPSDHKVVHEWLNDAIYDLPHRLKWLQDMFMDWRNAVLKWDAERVAEKFFQWRVYYAQQMLFHILKSFK